MTSNINQLVQESFGKVLRQIFIHKLVSSNESVDKELEMLKSANILTSTKDVYICSFLHPDGNVLMSFTFSEMMRPNQTFKAWYSYAGPSRGLLYKGVAQGQSPNSGFSLEAIQKPQFETNSFLFSGMPCKFKRLASINSEAISTTVPIPLPFLIGVYENIRINCSENSLKLNTIQFKRIKGFTLPQIFTKANYMFVFKCTTT